VPTKADVKQKECKPKKEKRGGLKNFPSFWAKEEEGVSRKQQAFGFRERGNRTQAHYLKNRMKEEK